MRKTVWKVVTDEDGRYFSYSVTSKELKREYELGKETRCPEPRVPLFAFKTHEDAMEFLSTRDAKEAAILECSAEISELFTPNHVPGVKSLTLAQAKVFWVGARGFSQYFPSWWEVPKGTILCESVTPYRVW